MYCNEIPDFTSDAWITSVKIYDFTTHMGITNELGVFKHRIMNKPTEHLRLKKENQQ